MQLNIPNKDAEKILTTWYTNFKLKFIYKFYSVVSNLHVRVFDNFTCFLLFIFLQLEIYELTTAQMIKKMSKTKMR